MRITAGSPVDPPIPEDKEGLERFKQATKEGFFAHKKAHPEPVPEDQMTPLQKRMQSGGASAEFKEIK